MVYSCAGSLLRPFKVVCLSALVLVVHCLASMYRDVVSNMDVFEFSDSYAKDAKNRKYIHAIAKCAKGNRKAIKSLDSRLGKVEHAVTGMRDDNKRHFNALLGAINKLRDQSDSKEEATSNATPSAARSSSSSAAMPVHTAAPRPLDTTQRPVFEIMKRVALNYMSVYPKIAHLAQEVFDDRCISVVGSDEDLAIVRNCVMRLFAVSPIQNGRFKMGFKRRVTVLECHIDGDWDTFAAFEEKYSNRTGTTYFIAGDMGNWGVHSDLAALPWYLDSVNEVGTVCHNWVPFAIYVEKKEQ